MTKQTRGMGVEDVQRALDRAVQAINADLDRKDEAKNGTSSRCTPRPGAKQYNSPSKSARSLR
jgi:hypothetical protein